jgi:hypothetical protein
MPLNTYVELQQFINNILTQNISTVSGGPEIQDVSNSPHKAFWTLPYSDFVNGNVPHVLDPVTGQPMKILVIGNSVQSNLILSLRGAAGTAFDPNTGAYGQMPADGPPMFTEAQIQEIADWIDRGCPQ